VASKGFTLRFTSAASPGIIQMTADELKRRGYEVETVQDEMPRIVCGLGTVEVNVEDEHLTTPEQSVAYILSKLAELELIPSVRKDDVYEAEDEMIIRARLESLGYL
jgi:hypothetical protein